MPEWIQLVLMGMGLELARIAGVYDRAGPVAKHVAAFLPTAMKRLKEEKARLQPPAVVRHETRWSMTKQANGAVILVLEEYLHATSEGGGRYAEVRAQMPEPVGTQLWTAVQEQRDTLVEKTLAEGTRVLDLEAGL